MAEIAVPMVGLGLLYIVQKQKDKENEGHETPGPLTGSRVEGFRNVGAHKKLQGYNTKTNYEVDIGKPKSFDESNKIVQNFPVESNKHVMDTVKSYPNPNCSTDKYFVQNEMQQNSGSVSKVEQMQNFQCDSLTGNKIEAKDFKHNNMVPFFGSKIRGRTYDYNADTTLDNMQGAGSQHIRKTEQAPLFKPQDSVQHAHGTPNNSDFYQSRMNPSMKVSNVKPWEEERVAPGLGKGFNTQGSGGFNSGMQAREAWEPKTVDELRTVNNPKLSFGGVTLGGKRPVQNSGVHGKVEKNRPDTFFVNCPERYLTTTGLEKAQTAQATQVFRPVSRVETTREHFGNNTSTNNKAMYPKGKYQAPHKVQCDGPPVINPYASNQGQASEKDYGKKSINLLPNSRSLTGEQNKFGGANGAVKALIAPLLDALRPSRRENAVGNIRESGNVQSHVPQSTVFNPYDRPKVTNKETTIDAKNNMFVQNQNNGGYENARYQPIENQRDSTNYQSMGNVGGGVGTSNATDYTSAYNARVSSGREEVSVNRPNRGGTQIFNQKTNISMAKLDTDRKNNRMFVPQNVMAANTTKEMYGSMRKVQSYNEPNESRIDSSLLKAFKENPYTQSLQSWA